MVRKEREASGVRLGVSPSLLDSQSSVVLRGVDKAATEPYASGGRGSLMYMGQGETAVETAVGSTERPCV